MEKAKIVFLLFEKEHDFFVARTVYNSTLVLSMVK